jgi:hypothetical protein
MNTTHRRSVPLFVFISMCSLAIAGGCEYDSPFAGDPPLAEQQDEMSTFYEDTGGDNQDPVLSGGQPVFCR